MSNLDLAVVGNSTVTALADSMGRVVWGCMPRPDSDAVFCALLQGGSVNPDFGWFAIELAEFEREEQAYEPNTAILKTRLFDVRGGAVEIVDFAPRFRQHGRMFCPATFVRRVRRIAGNPRITVRLRPAARYGARRPEMTWGSNHVRYLCDDFVLRATTDCSITALVEERSFLIADSVSFVLGPDETLQGSVADVCSRFYEDTAAYWRDWVRYLAIPFEWQEEIIRAAITLKLAAYHDTGAILAAVTTSIPEASHSGRNWDYRYCWLRDGYFVVNALNRLNTTKSMERYLDFIINIATESDGAGLQPVYRINGGRQIDEVEIGSLAGYLGMGPVRVGNQAWEQVQHDVYGSAILAATHVFFDSRLARQGDAELFRHLEGLGRRAAALHDKPDAGLWELRGVKRVHTFSALMCWVACDRLAKIAVRLGLIDRSTFWRAESDRIRDAIHVRAWSEKRQCFVSTFDGDELDASMLLLVELGFLQADDTRFARTVAAIEADLRRGDFIFRYTESDDFGVPENAFLVCTFWYIDALAALGRRAEARALFEKLLGCRNRHGLLSEHIDPRTGELWGNFPQTYSMVGLINSAMRLSIPWDQAY